MTDLLVNTWLSRVLDLQVIERPDVALALLDPVRVKVLVALVEPGSSTTVARVLAEPRQKINYHLRALERLGLVRLVEERPRAMARRTPLAAMAHRAGAHQRRTFSAPQR